MSEKQIKHLEFIQSIISRMNANSFQIKGLSITVVSALLAVYTSTRNPDFIFLGIFPTIIFWGLDTYYLCQEQKFRGLYNDVAGVTENPKKIKPFEMRPDLYKSNKANFISNSIWPVYLPIIIMLVIILIIINCNG